MEILAYADEPSNNNRARARHRAPYITRSAVGRHAPYFNISPIFDVDDELAHGIQVLGVNSYHAFVTSTAPAPASPGRVDAHRATSPSLALFAPVSPFQHQ